MYLLSPSLAAALLDGLFEHPARVFSCCAMRANNQSSYVSNYFHRLLTCAYGCDETSRTANRSLLRSTSARS